MSSVPSSPLSRFDDRGADRSVATRYEPAGSGAARGAQAGGPDRPDEAKDRLMGRIQDALPTGQGLSEESFRERHAMALGAIALLTVILGTVGLVNGDSVIHVGFELLPVVLPGVYALRASHRLSSTIAAAWALMACSSLLVHQTDGLIESHFLFFVLLPLVALYQDWRAFLGSIGYVVVSHALVGTLRPESMYNHDAAINNPVLWAVIHAVFVVALVIVLVVEWNFAEAEQRRTALATEDLHTAQSQLMQAQKLESIGQLAAGVAHEINTPVQYVSDNTRFLDESFSELTVVFDQIVEIARREDPETVDQWLADADVAFLRQEIPGAIEQSSDGLSRVAEIVRAMKDFSHPGTELAETDINKAITSTVTVSRSEWKYVSEMDLKLEPDLRWVVCNEGQIKQVILNMVVNAAHAIGDVVADDDKGMITIETANTDDGISISISDTGAGMPPDVQQRIFEQFFTTKEVGRGTGQGLAMAHEIVTSHGGRVDVDSEVGSGTTFTVTLPDAPSEPEGR